jgi:hypothetical protein
LRTGSQLNETRAFPDASRRGLLFSPRGRPERASSRERFLASRRDLHAPAPSATVRVFRGVCARQQPGRASVTEKLSISNEVGLCIQSADACQVSKTGHRLNAHCKSLQEMGSRSARTRTRTRARKGGLGKPRSKSPTGWVSCPRPAHSRARDRRVIAVDRPAATSTSSGQRTGERSGRRTTAHSSCDARSGGFRSAADRVTPDEIRHHVRRGTLLLLHERASTATGSVPRTAASRRQSSLASPRKLPPRALRTVIPAARVSFFVPL